MEPRLKTTDRVRGAAREMEAGARAMRRDPTPAERRLWQALRSRQLAGIKFRRQYPLGPFILDFCCPERRLVVELDGGAHAESEQAVYDQARTQHLQRFGYRVIRFPNAAVLTDLPAVLDRIRRAAAEE